MLFSQQIRAFLAEKNIKQQELQEVLNMSTKQSLNSKIANNRWDGLDIVQIMEFLGGQVILKVDDREIVLTEKHFAKKSKPKSKPESKPKSESVPKLDLDALLADNAPPVKPISDKRIKLT